MVKCSKAEVRRLQTALRWKLPSTQRERIQMVLLREGGMTQPAIAAAMGVSLSTVRAHMATMTGASRHSSPERTADASARHDRGRGRPAGAFAQLREPASVTSMISRRLRKAIGHPTSDSTVYNLLHGMAGVS